MSESFDALIIGGGPAGATTALLLARAGWSVALLERKCFPRRKVCGEYLSATNLHLFDELGLGEVFRERAGPEVRRVALFARRSKIITDLPRPSQSDEWGRALSREHLDTVLVAHAKNAGAVIYQPWRALSVLEDGDQYRCRAQCQETNQEKELTAQVIIAASGSWERSSLPGQARFPSRARSALLGFKAHFQGGTLESDLMPLLAFPGGYGGMVECDDNRVSLSCCIRRDLLKEIQSREQGLAGELVLKHIRRHCLGVEETLSQAQTLGEWLAIGPIRPGIRLPGQGGIFLVGNAAGEAHPVIAEGISMAMQSAWLLTSNLLAWNRQSRESLEEVQQSYARQWRRAFAPRLRTSRLVALWAMRPWLVSLSLPLIRWFPSILNWGARLSGKARTVTTATQS